MTVEAFDDELTLSIWDHDLEGLGCGVGDVFDALVSDQECIANALIEFIINDFVDLDDEYYNYEADYDIECDDEGFPVLCITLTEITNSSGKRQAILIPDGVYFIKLQFTGSEAVNTPASMEEQALEMPTAFVDVYFEEPGEIMNAALAIGGKKELPVNTLYQFHGQFRIRIMLDPEDYKKGYPCFLTLLEYGKGLMDSDEHDLLLGDVIVKDNALQTIYSKLKSKETLDDA